MKLFQHLKGDRVIWIILFLLFIFSLLAVFSATGMIAYKYQDGNTGYYFLKHFFLLGFGFLIVYSLHRVPYKIYFNVANILMVSAVILLLLTPFLGVTRNEATRWITIPFIGLEFQTSDVGKFALIVFLAKTLSMYQDTKDTLNKAFKHCIVAIFIISGLILMNNFSTAALILGISWVILFIGRIDNKYLFGLIGVAIVAFLLFILIVISADKESRLGTWQNRITEFFKEDVDPNSQSVQSKIAIVKGGLFGVGPGNSDQRNILPHPYSDFIYSIIIEEYGLVGGTVVLSLYIILLFRTVVMVRKLNRTFPAFLSIGLSISLVMQALMNMAVAVGLFPVTGQPLPFVSMGGTSILFACMAVGIILNISRYAEKEEDAVVDESREFEVKDYPFISG